MPPNPAPTPTESASATPRGRAVASKPLNTSATRSAGASASASAAGKAKRTPSAASTSSKASSTSANAPRAAPSSSSRASSRGSESGGGGFKVTKLSSTTVTLETTWTPRPPKPMPSSASASSSISKSQATASLPTSSVAEQQPTRTTDPLQVAAQVYPWTYMTSTLDACFKGAEAAATNDLETRAKELSEEESELAEQRDRLEAERAIDFFEELGTGAFAKDAPEIMQLFHLHGDSCARVETEALKLALRNGPDPDDEEPLKVYSDMLQVLEQLHQEATTLHASITKLTEVPSSQSTTTTKVPAAAEPTTASTEDGAGAESEPAPSSSTDTQPTTTVAETTEAHSQVSSVFASCLPVLRARIANLTMAQELIDTALENVSLGLRMESMGIA